MIQKIQFSKEINKGWVGAIANYLYIDGKLEKNVFVHASKEDRRGPVGDVRLARTAECIHYLAAPDMGSITPLAARRITSAQDSGASWRQLAPPNPSAP